MAVRCRVDSTGQLRSKRACTGIGDRFRIIDRLIAKRSLDLCWNTGLHPRDALHLAVALEEGCDVLETRDGKLLRNNGLEGLTIRESFWEVQIEMADDKD